MDEAEKRRLLSHLGNYLIDSGIATPEQLARGQNFPCPDPSHRDSTPSAHYFEGPNEPHVFCYGCGSAWNLFSMIRLREGVQTFSGQIERARELYGSERSEAAERRPEYVHKPKTVPERQESSQEMKEEIRRYIEAMRRDVLKTDYWAQRGFAKEFVLEQGFGYDSRRKRLIIPTDYSYVARTVLPASYADAKSIPRYMNHKGMRASLLGEDEMRRPGTVYIVEGAIDAMAIRQAGGRAIGLNSTSNAALLVKSACEKGAEADVIIALDSDEPGQTRAIELAEGLKAAGCRAKLLLSAWGRHKDAGEWLETEGVEALKGRLTEMTDEKEDSIAEARQDKETYDRMFHRLKERKPEHATAELLGYWQNVMDEMRETIMCLHQAQNTCKTLKLWSLAIDQASKEFEFPAEDMKKVRETLDTLSEASEHELKDWQFIYGTVEKLDIFSAEMIRTVAEMQKANPVFRLPEVQHAMTAEEAMTEPPPKTPQQVYYALLKKVAKESAGVLVNEADVKIEEILRAKNKSIGEIGKILACSPCLANAPEEKRGAMAKDVARNLEKAQEKSRGASR